jgi:hypothetical protein
VAAHADWAKRGKPEKKKTVLEVLLSAPRPDLSDREIERLFGRARSRR